MIPTPSWGGAEVGDYQVPFSNDKNCKQIASRGVPVGDGEDVNLNLAFACEIDIACAALAANTHSFDPAASWPPPATLDFENENAVADWAYAASLADANRRTEIAAHGSFRFRVRRGAAIQSALQSSINDAIHEINKACAATAANASDSNNNNTAIPDDHGDGQVFNT